MSQTSRGVTISLFSEVVHRLSFSRDTRYNAELVFRAEICRNIKLHSMQSLQSYIIYFTILASLLAYFLARKCNNTDGVFVIPITALVFPQTSFSPQTGTLTKGTQQAARKKSAHKDGTMTAHNAHDYIRRIVSNT